MRKVLLIPVVAVLLGGCSIFSGDELDFDGWVSWIEFLQENRELVDELIEVFKEDEAPDPPKDDDPKGPLYYLPEFVTMTYQSELPLGVQLCSSSYVPGNDPNANSGSFAIGKMTLVRQGDGVRREYCWGVLKVESPPDISTGGPAYNFRDYDGASNCKHLYSTAYKQNEAGAIDCPLADGTRRGRILLEFSEEGSWDVFIYYRATLNRTSSAFLGITIEGEDGSPVTVWHTWNQRGYGEGEEGYVTVPVGSGIIFKRGPTNGPE